MTVHLLDVNVLIGMMWPSHESHGRVQSWFENNPKAGWATCPLTQAAFVRIVSNPGFSRDAVTPSDALQTLEENLRHPLHQFWPDDISLVDAVTPVRKRIVGHQQLTDAYLLGLAIYRKSKLLTLDRSIMALLPLKEREVVTVL